MRIMSITIVLLAIGALGYYIECAQAEQMPDVVGFGVPWSHELHARLAAPEFNCKNCHHQSTSSDVEMSSCDTDGCHLRGPAMEAGIPRLARLKATFVVELSQRETAIEAVSISLRQSPRVHRIFGTRSEPATVEVSDDEDRGEQQQEPPPRVSIELVVDVLDRGDEPAAEMSSTVGSMIENSSQLIESVRVSTVPTQRLALHRTCIGCHNAKQQGPREECAECHADNRGNASCGSCHEEILAQLGEGAHKLVSCSACHSRDAMELVGEASHVVEVPIARMRQDCLSCHGAPEGEDPTGFPQKRLSNDQLPAVRATAYQAHRPRPTE